MRMHRDRSESVFRRGPRGGTILEQSRAFPSCSVAITAGSLRERCRPEQRRAPAETVGALAFGVVAVTTRPRACGPPRDVACSRHKRRHRVEPRRLFAVRCVLVPEARGGRTRLAKPPHAFKRRARKASRFVGARRQARDPARTRQPGRRARDPARTRQPGRRAWDPARTRQPGRRARDPAPTCRDAKRLGSGPHRPA